LKRRGNKLLAFLGKGVWGASVPKGTEDALLDAGASGNADAMCLREFRLPKQEERHPYPQNLNMADICVAFLIDLVIFAYQIGNPARGEE